APIVAKMCQEMGILTVGIVTTPFSYEGKKRIQQAELGIAELKKHVDTLLVISNDKLRHQFGNLTMRAAFSKADNVLATATKCITDVISTTGQINLDFADVCTVMSNVGVAILGSSIANVEDRAKQAIEMAINSPLLNDSDIRGAKWILININSSEGEHEFTMDEVEIIQSYLLAHAGQDANVLLGMGYEPGLGDNISITVIATGFEHKDPFKGAMVPEEKPEVQEEQKIVMQLGVQGEEVKMIHSDPAQPEAALPVEEAITDALAPRLVEPEVPVVSNTINTDNEENDTTEHFVLNLELSNKPELPAIEEVSIEKLEIRNEVTPDSETDMQLIEKNEGEINKTSETDVCSPEYSISKPVVTGGFLSKPSNIYAEEVDQIASPETDPSTVERQNSVELEVPKTEEVNAVVNPLSASVEEEQPEMEMKMVYKETDITEKVEFPVTTRVLGGMEELDMLDDAEEQRRKANDRLQKLRNLSFNLNTADPNNEYDTVPAYVRRNMEMYSNSHLASVEKFYSNYSIKGDDENKGQLSRLNSFLDGKKPD
ncbi:MAG: cell division protein FtsZ, partial [Sphingobacteriales bacterium]